MKAAFEKHSYFNLMAKKVSGFRGFPPMFHSHCELLYIADGALDVTIDGISHTLRAGEMSIVFPYVTHCYEDSPNCEVMMFLFDASSAGIFESTLLSRKPSFPFTDKLSELSEIMERIITLSESGDSVKEKIAISYFGAVIGELINIMPLYETVSDSPDISQRVLTYCSDHFSDEDISIEKIANALYISPSYISKIFSTKLRYKFREYINALRISHAKKLIASGEMKIIDIMYECGFKNQSSFNRIFIDICGMSPSDYRRSKLRADPLVPLPDNERKQLDGAVSSPS